MSSEPVVALTAVTLAAIFAILACMFVFMAYSTHENRQVQQTCIVHHGTWHETDHDTHGGFCTLPSTVITPTRKP